MTRKDVESLFKTHYTQMYHLALTLLFDEARSKDVVSEVFANLLSGSNVVRADNAKAFLMAECVAAHAGARTLCSLAH